LANWVRSPKAGKLQEVGKEQKPQTELRRISNQNALLINNSPKDIDFVAKVHRYQCRIFRRPALFDLVQVCIACLRMRGTMFRSLSAATTHASRYVGCLGAFMLSG
jgi:hypothetical protein